MKTKKIQQELTQQELNLEELFYIFNYSKSETLKFEIWEKIKKYLQKNKKILIFIKKFKQKLEKS